MLRLQDIYKPESARLRRHLSALVNFAKFREEKLVVYR
jgi:kinetochore protein Nuf2